MSDTLDKRIRLEAAFLQLIRHNRQESETFLAALQDFDAELVNDFLIAPKDEIFQAQGALGMLRGLVMRLTNAEATVEKHNATIAANAKRITP